MEDAVFKWITDNFPGLAIVIVFVITAAYLVRRFTKWEDKHNERHEKNEQEHEKLMKLLSESNEKINSIERFLIKNGGAEPNEFTRMKSPRQLSEKGWKLFKESGAFDFFNKNKDGLMRLLNAELSRMKHVTAYDVDTTAAKICFDLSDNKEFKEIKDFVYTHPIYEGINILINTITMLMGIELRNEYLKLHPEIDPMSEQVPS